MFTSQLIGEIVALSVIVLAITQAVKKWAKADGSAAFIISAVLTVLVVLWKTLSVEPYDWSKFIILTVGVFLQANGIYQFGSYAIGKMAKKEG